MITQKWKENQKKYKNRINEGGKKSGENLML